MRSFGDLPSLISGSSRMAGRSSGTEAAGTLAAAAECDEWEAAAAAAAEEGEGACEEVDDDAGDGTAWLLVGASGRDERPAAAGLGEARFGARSVWDELKSMSAGESDDEAAGANPASSEAATGVLMAASSESESNGVRSTRTADARCWIELAEASSIESSGVGDVGRVWLNVGDQHWRSWLESVFWTSRRRINGARVGIRLDGSYDGSCGAGMLAGGSRLVSDRVDNRDALVVWCGCAGRSLFASWLQPGLRSAEVGFGWRAAHTTGAPLHVRPPACRHVVSPVVGRAGRPPDGAHPPREDALPPGDQAPTQLGRRSVSQQTPGERTHATNGDRRLGTGTPAGRRMMRPGRTEADVLDRTPSSPPLFVCWFVFLRRADDEFAVPLRLLPLSHWPTLLPLLFPLPLLPSVSDIWRRHALEARRKFEAKKSLTDQGAINSEIYTAQKWIKDHWHPDPYNSQKGRTTGRERKRTSSCGPPIGSPLYVPFVRPFPFQSRPSGAALRSSETSHRHWR